MKRRHKIGGGVLALLAAGIATAVFAPLAQRACEPAEIEFSEADTGRLVRPGEPSAWSCLQALHLAARERVRVLRDDGGAVMRTHDGKTLLFK